MDIKYRLYPYPVLAEFNDSYENVEFSVYAKMVRDGFDLAINISTVLTDECLRKFIAEGKAAIVYHLECSQTGLREIKETDSYEYTINISGSKVSGELHLCPFIIAKTDILDYYNSNFNPHYDNPVKKIELGYVLAIGKQHNWTINKNMEDMLNTSSPFRILPNIDESQQQMVVEYQGEKFIRIKLRKEDYALYKTMKKDPRLKDILNSAIVVPALIYVLEELQKCDPDELDLNYSGLQWYDSIKNSLKKNFDKDIKNIREEKAFELGQKMLRTPIGLALENLTNIGSTEKGEDDE